MTTRDVVFATGIQLKTVYARIDSGELPATWTGTRWNISASDCLDWAAVMWARGRCLMYPPDRVAKCISDFDLDSPKKRRGG